MVWIRMTEVRYRVVIGQVAKMNIWGERLIGGRSIQVRMLTAFSYIDLDHVSPSIGSGAVEFRNLFNANSVH